VVRALPGRADKPEAKRRYRSGTITATADHARVVTEANEDNNTATRVVRCLGIGS